MSLARIPSLNWLRVFAVAAREENFARAAAALNMTGSAVGQQIRALEGHLGRALFVRGARSVRLTEAGLAFLPSVDRALAELDSAASGLFGPAGGAAVTLRVSQMTAVSWLAPRLPGFRLRRPDIAVTLLTGELPDPDPAGRTEADLSVVFGGAPGPGEAATTLFGERLFPVATPERAARIGDADDLARAPAVDVVTHRASRRHVLEAAGATVPAVPAVALTDTTLAALAIAATGAAVALARAPASDTVVAAFGLVPCLPGLEVPGRDVYRIRHRIDGLTPAVRAVRDWLLEEAAAER